MKKITGIELEYTLAHICDYINMQIRKKEKKEGLNYYDLWDTIDCMLQDLSEDIKIFLMEE